MKTKWDVLFALFECEEAKLSRISKKVNSSESATRQKLKELIGNGLVFQENNLYKPNKQNSKTFNVFKIMKYSKHKGINFNILLSDELGKIVKTGLSKEQVTLSDFKNLSYKTVRKYLTYLNRINLVFITSKKPLKIKFVEDPVFQEILEFFDIRLPARKQKKIGIPKSAYDEISTLLKKFKLLKKDMGLTDMEKEMRIEFVSASTQLEGNTFTLEESIELILHDLVPEDKKLREANEVKNYFNAVNFLVSNLNSELTIEMIIDLHKISMQSIGIKEGIRSTAVSIKGNPFYKVAPFSEIFHQLDELCKKINSFNHENHSIKEVIEFASFVHNEFQHIHPFEDGNSRVTRLIWNYVLMRNEFPLINIYSNVREEYLSHTKLAKDRNDSKLNAFLVKIIADNLFKRIKIN